MLRSTLDPRKSEARPIPKLLVVSLYVPFMMARSRSCWRLTGSVSSVIGGTISSRSISSDALQRGSLRDPRRAGAHTRNHACAYGCGWRLRWGGVERVGCMQGLVLGCMQGLVWGLVGVSPRHLSERLAEGFAEEFDDTVVFRLRVWFWGQLVFRLRVEG